MKKTVWIVYDARDPYNGGADVLMACPTEPAAKCAAERISAFARRLNERVEALDALADGLSDDEYESLDLDVRVGPLLFVQKVT
jgi:hypothetical protein